MPHLDEARGEVVNGVFVAPPGSGPESEHGSFTVDQMSRWGGRVAAFRPGSLDFAGALEAANRSSAYGDADMGPTWAAIGCR